MDSSLSSPSSLSCDPLHYDQVINLTFHHIDYIIHAYVKHAIVTPSSSSASSPPQNANSSSQSSITMPILVLEAEQRTNGQRWVGEFSAKYIEEMSLKTGNFKRFPLFIRMLSSSLSKTTDHVFVDLLTFQDLEVLKRKQQGNNYQQTAQNTKTNASHQNKRYLILTYVAEFDRVHYPLPLRFEAQPSLQSMQMTIARLRAENDALRRETERTNDGAPPTASAHPSLSSDQQHVLAQKELEIDDLKRRLSVLSTSDVAAMQVTIENQQKQIVALQEELFMEQRAVKSLKSKHEYEQKIVMDELEKRLEAERLLRIKCRQLSVELEEARDNTRAPSRPRTAGGNTATRNARSRARSRTPPVESSHSLYNTSSHTNSRTSSRANSRNSSRSVSPALTPTGNTRARRLSNSSVGSTQSNPRSRSASPSQRVANRSTQAQRFDPSAYIKYKQEQLRQTQARREKDRQIERNTGSRPGSATRARSSSLGRASSSSSLNNSSDSPLASRSNSHKKRSKLETEEKSASSRHTRTTPVRSSKHTADSADVDERKAQSSRPSRQEQSSADEQEHANRQPIVKSKDSSNINQRISALQSFLHKE